MADNGKLIFSDFTTDVSKLIYITDPLDSWKKQLRNIPVTVRQVKVESLPCKLSNFRLKKPLLTNISNNADLLCVRILNHPNQTHLPIRQVIQLFFTLLGMIIFLKRLFLLKVLKICNNIIRDLTVIPI